MSLKPTWRETTPHPEQPVFQPAPRQRSSAERRIDIALGLLVVVFAAALLLRAAAAY